MRDRDGPPPESSPAVVEWLKGPDRRSIGAVARVVEMAECDPSVVRELVDALQHESEVVRMRSADALEKISREYPDWLQPYVDFLAWEVADLPQSEVRWHMAQLLPRLVLSVRQRARCVELFTDYLEDPSSIVKTFAMQALFDLSDGQPVLRRKVFPRLRELAVNGTPAMRARGKRLLQQIEKGKNR